MSRGLGRRQALILHALAQLEREEGRGRFYVWGVLGVVWELGLQQEEADARATRKAAETLRLTGLQVRAAAADQHAHAQLRQHFQARPLPAVARQAADVRQRRPEGSHLVEGVNPSRCLAKLAGRGLVERNGKRGPGASAGLTEAGRAEVMRMQGRDSRTVPASAGAA